MVKCFVFLLATILPVLVSAKDKSPEFLTESQLYTVANELLNQIERVDGVSISVRNNTRAVKWKEYKQQAFNKIVSSSNWGDFKRHIEYLHLGVINRHAFINFELSGVRVHESAKKTWPKLNLGYTWPKISFYDLGSGKAVTKVDDLPLTDLFEEYFNFYCRFANDHGCLKTFVNHLSQGYPFSDSRSEVVVMFESGARKVIRQSGEPNTSPKSKKLPINCENLYPKATIKLIFSGVHTCLFSAENTYIVKILSFPRWGTEQSDFYCQNPTAAGLCKEMREVVRQTHTKVKENLILDVQGNRGGSENTPWIAALTQNGFKDNFVQYKNIKELNDVRIRSGVFYGVTEAESWYQALTQDKRRLKERFLPMRGDFCRDDTCKGELIKSNSSRFQYKQLAIVSDYLCASSCDDLIWRSKQFAGAKVYGQPSNTDGAYASIKGHIVLTKAGEVKTYFNSGYSQTPDFGEDHLLITFQIPITKTVDEQGKLLEGDSSVLDFPLDVNRTNFDDLQQDNLLRTLKQINQF